MRTVKNRKRKFALGMKIVAMFSCIAIASVGFAAWIIVNKPADVQGSGTITASTVSEQGLTMQVGAITGSIILDASDGTNKDSDWLISDRATEEALEVTVPVICTVDNIEQATINIDLMGKMASEEEPSDAYTAKLKGLIDSGYITVSVYVVSSDGSSRLGTSNALNTASGQYEATATIQFGTGAGKFELDGEGKATFNIKVVFDWGTKFSATIDDVLDNYNPYTFYNSKNKGDLVPETSKTWAQDARETLTAIYDATMNGTPETTDDLCYHLNIAAILPTP